MVFQEQQQYELDYLVIKKLKSVPTKLSLHHVHNQTLEKTAYSFDGEFKKLKYKNENYCFTSVWWKKKNSSICAPEASKKKENSNSRLYLNSVPAGISPSPLGLPQSPGTSQPLPTTAWTNSFQKKTSISQSVSMYVAPDSCTFKQYWKSWEMKKKGGRKERDISLSFRSLIYDNPVISSRILC